MRSRVDSEALKFVIISDLELASAGEKVEFVYRADFRAVPTLHRIRPPKPKPAPRVGDEQAVVIGPPGTSIYVDAANRVQVKFLWADQSDTPRDGNPDLYGIVNNTCFLQVKTPWAGPGYGMQFPLRVGMLVTVKFYGGQSDRPYVEGCDFTDFTERPFKSDHMVGIRTRSEPGGRNHSELSFDDVEDREKVTLRAAKDLDETVLGERHASIGGSSSTVVKGEVSASVGGRQIADIAGARKVSVGGDADERIAGHEFRSIGGSADERIGGSASQSIGGRCEVTVRGACTAIYGDDRRTTIDGVEFVRVGRSLIVDVGGAKGDGEYSTTVRGLAKHQADRILIKATEKLELQCGETVLTLTPDSMKAIAKMLAQEAETVSISTSDASLKLDKKAILETKDAAIELSDSPCFKGAKFSLGSGSGAADDVKRETKKDEKIKRRFKVAFTEAGEPLKSAPYEVVFDGADPIKGSTDGSGAIDLDAGPAKVAWVTVGERSYVYDLVDKFPPATEEHGARTRLGYLGFHSADGLSNALLAFQFSRGLAPTGELDDATSAQLGKELP